MMPCMNTVNTLQTCFLLEGICQTFCNTIDTSYGRYNPYFITYSDITILTHISLKSPVLLCYCQLFVNRIVGVFQRAGEICLEIVLVNPLTGFQGLSCVAYRIAILYYIFAFCLVCKQYFVSLRGVLKQCNGCSVNVNYFTFLHWLQTYNNRVSRIDFQKFLFHIIIISLKFQVSSFKFQVNCQLSTVNFQFSIV